MKNILLGYVLLLMVVSCVGQHKRSESLSDEQGIELLQTDSVSISDEELSDTLIVVDEVVPTTADASFIDFLYYFTSDEEFQHSRIQFPVSFYDETAVTRLTSDEWVFDPMIDSEKIYNVIFEKEDELELENDTPSGSVQIDDNVAKQLAAFLCPYVAECVSFAAEEIAAVFKDCHGSAHVPDAQIPTCTEMDTAIEEATKPVVATAIPSVTDATDEVDLPTIIVGKQRDQLLGRPDAWLKWGDYLIPAYVAE